jgi:hypothetical protein
MVEGKCARNANAGDYEKVLGLVTRHREKLATAKTALLSSIVAMHRDD